MAHNKLATVNKELKLCGCMLCIMECDSNFFPYFQQ